MCIDSFCDYVRWSHFVWYLPGVRKVKAGLRGGQACHVIIQISSNVIRFSYKIIKSYQIFLEQVWCAHLLWSHGCNSPWHTDPGEDVNFVDD